MAPFNYRGIYSISSEDIFRGMRGIKAVSLRLHGRRGASATALARKEERKNEEH
jgi:hypothetical protein